MLKLAFDQFEIQELIFYQLPQPSGWAGISNRPEVLASDAYGITTGKSYRNSSCSGLPRILVRKSEYASVNENLLIS